MKRYITIINLILLTAVIQFGVRDLYKIAAAKLDVAAVIPGSAAETASLESEPDKPLSYYQPVYDRHLFGKEAVTTPRVEQISIDTLKQTQLKLKLWGTVIGSNNRTYAVIEAEREGQNLYRVGDSIQNAVIKMILREKVVLNVGGQDEVLEMEKVAGSSPAIRTASVRTAVSEPQNIAVKRSLIEAAVQNPNQLLQEVRIRPHFDKGKLDGLTISAIKPDSIFRKMGLISGDVLTSFNGEKIESMDDALKFYESIKSAQTLKLDIRRRGRMQTIEYKIEPE